MSIIQLEDVLAARARIKRAVHKTPLMRSQKLSRMLGCRLYLKAEHLQKTGSFKARGAMHFLVNDPEPGEVYTTYSSGNHGQALSWAAEQTGKKAVIFMPEDASPAKVAAVKGYGGEVRYAGLSSIDRMNACLAFEEESGARVVPPFDHENIIAGQGTAMLEVLEDLPHFDVALVPTGGGGLLSGNSFVLKTLRKNAQIYACEPEVAADVKASLESGELKSIAYPATIADGLRNLRMGERNWAIIEEHVDGGLTCTEAGIRGAMRLYATYQKQFVEPSGACTLACLMENRDRFAGKTVVVYVSGGNIALPDYGRLVGEDEGQSG
ncbi:MAG: threonine/serine dehydratase [Acidobacteriota bacterium]|nr:threonine/serine dehydratase [Acidobacteriota bacterium]